MDDQGHKATLAAYQVMRYPSPIWDHGAAVELLLHTSQAKVSLSCHAVATAGYQDSYTAQTDIAGPLIAQVIQQIRSYEPIRCCLLVLQRTAQQPNLSASNLVRTSLLLLTLPQGCPYIQCGSSL